MGETEAIKLDGLESIDGGIPKVPTPRKSKDDPSPRSKIPNPEQIPIPEKGVTFHAEAAPSSSEPSSASSAEACCGPPDPSPDTSSPDIIPPSANGVNTDSSKTEVEENKPVVEKRADGESVLGSAWGQKSSTTEPVVEKKSEQQKIQEKSFKDFLADKGYDMVDPSTAAPDGNTYEDPSEMLDPYREKADLAPSESKEKGNKFFKEGRIHDAIYWYTQSQKTILNALCRGPEAMQDQGLSELDLTLNLNLAQCYIKLKDWKAGVVNNILLV